VPNITIGAEDDNEIDENENEDVIAGNMYTR